jgi:acyl-[acyl-carrier-protein]-phospholipid O-acyltransferase/long-chain-fatty-acid--[acyl-carrier-protein] ligase
MLPLLAARRFGPLFATQFLGAFNDNLFKTAFIFAVTFHWRSTDPAAAATLATAAAGVFIAPYILFSGLAGEVADARDKAAIARLVKVMEILFMAGGWAALLLCSEALCLLVLALMGLHATLFGPVKYAILPQHLAPSELLLGTGLVEAGTFVAILLGQVAGGLLPIALAGPIALALATLGWLSARLIPPAPPETPGQSLRLNPLHSTRAALAEAFSSRALAIATIAISWFWALGAIYTSQFVPLARNHLGGTEAVATLFLTSFSIGIALGSAVVARLLHGRITARLTIPALIAMALAGLDLWFAEAPFTAAPAGGISAFLARPAGWRVLADLLVMAIAGGIFSVPLYGILQTETRTSARARTIAANNIVNAVFQVAGVLAIGLLLSGGVAVPTALAAAALSAVLLVPLLLRLRQGRLR